MIKYIQNVDLYQRKTEEGIKPFRRDGNFLLSTDVNPITIETQNSIDAKVKEFLIHKSPIRKNINHELYGRNRTITVGYKDNKRHIPVYHIQSL